MSDFLGFGRSVYSVDAFRSGRAGFPPIRDLGALPQFRSKRFAWEVFRLGPAGSYAPPPARPQPYDDSLFPVAAFDAFASGLTPRFPIDFAKDEPSYRAVLERACPCILVTHSASGPVGFALAARYPALIRGHVAVEPSGGPAAAGPPSQVPQLIVWGDHLEASDWRRQVDEVRAYAAQVRAGGGQVEWLDLPAHGVRGNSHMLMSDRNSRDVARRIERWMATRVG